MLEEEIKQKIIGILSVLFPKAKIYLFGSRATGKNQEFSDIDIALDMGKKISFTDLDQAKAVLAGLNIPYTIDIVDMHGVSDKILYFINNEKIAWKS